MLQPNALTAQEDGSITYADADDITVVEPITKPVQTAGGYTRHEPDHELAALMAAAPDLLAALQKCHAFIDSLLDATAYEAAYLISNNGEAIHDQAFHAIARATNPDYVQNSIGQTRDNPTTYTDPALDAILDAEEPPRDRIFDPLLDIIEEAEAKDALVSRADADDFAAMLTDNP